MKTRKQRREYARNRLKRKAFELQTKVDKAFNEFMEVSNQLRHLGSAQWLDTMIAFARRVGERF